MSTLTVSNSLESKIRDLCQAILEDSQVQMWRDQIEAFLEDDEARDLYAAVMQKSDELHRKQHQGLELTDADIDSFNSLRDKAFADARVQSFSAARGSLQEVEDKVGAYVQKTLELGRMPTPDEATPKGGGCCGGGGGGGCGCH